MIHIFLPAAIGKLFPLTSIVINGGNLVHIFIPTPFFCCCVSTLQGAFQVPATTATQLVINTSKIDSVSASSFADGRSGAYGYLVAAISASPSESSTVSTFLLNDLCKGRTRSRPLLLLVVDSQIEALQFLGTMSIHSYPHCRQ